MGPKVIKYLEQQVSANLDKVDKMLLLKFLHLARVNSYMSPDIKELNEYII